MSNNWKRIGALALITIACTVLHVLKLIFRWRIGGLGIPISLGAIKDLIDTAFVFLIPWGGWPVAIIEIFGRVLKVDFKWRAIYSFVSACCIGIVSAYYSFERVGVSQILTSMATYIFICGAVLLVTFAAIGLFTKLASR